jgi:IS1 family transposase
MNRLSVEERARILASLCEGASIRATSRITGAAKGTIIRLLRDVGAACWVLHDAAVRNLDSQRIQCDEIWSYCGVKERNLPLEQRGTDGIGDMWTWTAIDSDTKLIVSWHLGKRLRFDAEQFIADLAQRVASENVQISTDGFGAYAEAIQRFIPRADHGSEVKEYGHLDDMTPDRKYSPMVVTSVRRTAIWGDPDPDHISTAHVERNNLTMRMNMRRFTRLTNGFSKKAENLAYALALHFAYYNFVRKHQTIKMTPAMKAGLTDRYWTLLDLAKLPDQLESAA